MTILLAVLKISSVGIDGIKMKKKPSGWSDCKKLEVPVTTVDHILYISMDFPLLHTPWTGQNTLEHADMMVVLI